MRIFSSLALLLSFLTTSASQAAAAEPPGPDLVLHVDEGALPGQHVGDLPDLLEFGEQSTSRLLPQSSSGFEIDSTGQLVVAGNASLDHESRRTHTLTIEIKTPAAADPLQDRFVKILGESTAGSHFADRTRWDRRLVRAQVVIDDQPEPPQILEQVFRSVQAAALVPGLDLGQVIAVDPDRGDQLRFRLLDSDSLMNIDPESGRLSLNEQATALRISQIRATVEVVDSHGLAASRVIVVPIRGYPKQPARDRQDLETAAGAHQNDTEPSGSGPVPEPATPVATTDAEPALATIDLAQEPPVVVKSTPPEGMETPVGVTSPVPEETEPVETPVTESKQPGPLATPVPTAVAQMTPPAGNEYSSAAWLLICFVCVLVFTVLCWGPLQHQIQKLILEPEPVESVPSDTDAADQRLNRPGTAATTDTDSETGQAVAGSRGKRDTRELHSLLASLDESYRPRPQQKSVAGSATVDDENFVIFDDEPSGTSSTTAIAKAVKHAQDSALLPATTDSNAGSQGTERAQQQISPSGKSERDQMEEFRKISRTYSRADIDRSRRAQMRGEWMSRGAAVASCAMTGVICLFTNCFGPMSVPSGTVLLAVAAALLMKRSLYFESSKATDEELLLEAAEATVQTSTPPAES